MCSDCLAQNFVFSSLFGHSLLEWPTDGWTDGWMDGWLLTIIVGRLLLFFLCRCQRLIVCRQWTRNVEKVIYAKTRISRYEIDASQYCMLVKLAINVKFYLSVMSFRNGFFTHYSLSSSYLIKIGSGFLTMQLVGLAPYFNGARFLRYSRLEFLSVSFFRSLHPPSAILFWLAVCVQFLYLLVQLQQQTTFDAFCTQVNRAWIHTKLSRQNLLLGNCPVLPHSR
jgi:hypothetical protein